jgi:hypothetical protein
MPFIPVPQSKASRTRNVSRQLRSQASIALPTRFAKTWRKSASSAVICPRLRYCRRTWTPQFSIVPGTRSKHFPASRAERLGLLLSLAGESARLGRDVRNTGQLSLSLSQVLAHCEAVLFTYGQINKICDRFQWVVDFMSDRASQAPNDGQLFRFAKSYSSLQKLLLGCDLAAEFLHASWVWTLALISRGLNGLTR